MFWHSFLSLSYVKFMGGEYLNESCKVIFTKICTRQFTGMCAIIYPPQKTCFKPDALLLVDCTVELSTPICTFMELHTLMLISPVQ